jgi:hypothetical protein
LAPIMIFLSGIACSSGVVFVSSWFVKSILPLGRSGGSSVLFFVDSRELIFLCDL